MNPSQDPYILDKTDEINRFKQKKNFFFPSKNDNNGLKRSTKKMK